MRKVLFLVLIICMTFYFWGTALASADELVNEDTDLEAESFTTVIGDETYTYEILEDGTAKITFYHDEDYKNIPDVTSIPEEIDGYQVSTLDDMSYSKSDIDPYWRAFRTLFIPDCVTKIVGNPFANVQSFSVNPSHPTLAVIDGALFNKQEKSLIEADDYAPIIPEGIKKLGTRSYHYDSDKNMVIPESVEEIDDYAFVQGSSIVSSNPSHVMTIKNGNVKIGNNPFLYCRELIKIQITSDHYIFDKESRAFYDTNENRFISMLRTSNSKDYVIPEGIETIGEHAFSYCDIERVTIPASVTSIGETAFENCDKLKEVLVDEGSYAEQYCKELGLYYSYASDDWLNN